MAGLHAALVNYGHFTSLQVRNAAVQGLDLHLQRLKAATVDLFGTPLDITSLLAAMRAVVATWPDHSCSMRITVFSRAFDFRRPVEAVPIDVLVAASEPARESGRALRVQSRRFERPLPHIKHVGTFPLFLAARQANQAGFDDALFVDGDGNISEGSVWNIAFWDGQRAIWPDADALRGTCEQLLQRGLGAAGVAQQVRPVRLSEMAGFKAAIATSSRGVRAISAIDSIGFAESDAFRERMADLLTAQPGQPI